MTDYTIEVSLVIKAKSRYEAIKYVHNMLVSHEDEPPYQGYRDMSVTNKEDEDEQDA